MNLFRRLSALGLSLSAVTCVALVSAAPTHSATSDASALATIESAEYSVVVKDGSGKVDQITELVVTLKAKEGYKVNDKYPHKIKLSDAPEGVELPKKLLKKEDGSFEGTKALTFKIPAKATKAGKFTIAGDIKFSVCNDQQCVIKKESLAAKLTAK
jgi:hypothetical protein